MSLESTPHRWHVAACLLTLSSLPGCGGEALTTVQGQVTYDQQPLTHGVIMFYRPEAAPISGNIMPDGNYVVGLPPGDYSVTIKSPPKALTGVEEGAAANKPIQGGIPDLYSRRTTSGLTALVAEDQETAQIDFQLTKP